MSDSNSEKVAMERRTICFPHHGTQGILQHGDKGFKDEIDRLYVPAENNAMEQLLELKTRLRTLPTEEFWGAVTEGISRILGAEICFVMKRVLVDDQNSAVEMPPIGEPGSCIMASALHYCANDGTRNTHNMTKFHAYGCPCAYMRHDKVFVIPDRLGKFITNNPNKLPTPCEAYMAVPLFEEGKCFAHFGAMWSVEGAAQRKLSWAFNEMILHSLEDMIAQRFVEGTDFIRSSTRSSQDAKSKVIPHDAVTIAQSLRPYAGSLSHELRTPMQGIVGMLDVMYATVQEAVETQNDPRIKRVFEQLKENIEIVQDSSRRAVEAADNVVHAYDMDMSIPEVPQALLDEPNDSPFSATVDRRPEILVAGNNLPINRPNKRRREEAGSRSGSDVSLHKFPRLARAPSSCQRCSEQDIQQGVREAEKISAQSQVGAVVADAPGAELAASTMIDAGRVIAPGLRHASFRELIQGVMSECLKVGGRPDYATTQETDFGEVMEVRTRGSDGTIGQKMIEWSIDPSVPRTMFIDEKDLCKLISCVLLNALKFTDKFDGRIYVHAKMSHRNRYISIKISDNGPGIPAAFLPKLFKPFSQENGSITRPSEGLGLGLMVGKGIARKLGGDLICTRAETMGPNHGTEFEIKVPVQAGETISRPASPFSSPMPRKATIVATNSPQIRPPPAPAAVSDSPRHFSQALHEVVSENPFAARMPLPKVMIPSTPPSPKSQCLNSGPDTDGESSSPPAPSLPSPPIEAAKPRPRVRKSVSNPEIDRDLAKKCPLTFLVAEDNKINRKLLVSMLSKFGYKNVLEAHDGAEAVRQMAAQRAHPEQVDVVLMDLWMPLMDGYEATERILGSYKDATNGSHKPTVLAVTADVTDGALERAAEVGMRGFMTKPYKMLDLQRLITEYCASHKATAVV
ncbi:hypothetical protein M409DRAFT_66595 [Zasmidium cellare ATCC 36951]|uniref:histidine kinase n=1 Tax=Zasmidium cellare ATCC 36951 TaxID=1080233 RepID=A0A6A6CK47_ZASCE|nr:uncharacterized protein M409DRAFT_66595 [Zasmidium cellare ATCC 36951]KAF2166578.1 hypothetical protein M409DRAFT_66595 [Zasmidium cellare ATCC 36951]